MFSPASGCIRCRMGIFTKENTRCPGSLFSWVHELNVTKCHLLRCGVPVLAPLLLATLARTPRSRGCGPGTRNVTGTLSHVTPLLSPQTHAIPCSWYPYWCSCSKANKMTWCKMKPFLFLNNLSIYQFPQSKLVSKRKWPCCAFTTKSWTQALK